MPLIVKFVFWQCVSLIKIFLPLVDTFYSILLFYLLSIAIIGFNGEPFPQLLISDVFSHPQL